jgi:hypothetical protein
MTFDYKNFTAENKEKKIAQAISFGKYIIEKDVIDSLGLNNEDKYNLLENLINIHEICEKYEICEKLKKIKEELSP